MHHPTIPTGYLIYADTHEGNLLDIPGCQEMTAYATLQEAVDAAWGHVSLLGRKAPSFRAGI